LPKLTLKIDADTYRGTRVGVPNLINQLRRHGASATFLFSLGPDHTGWALKQIFRPGFFSKVSRTSVVEHYGLKTLMYGTLLPAPDIGKTCAEFMRAARRRFRMRHPHLGPPCLAGRRAHCRRPMDGRDHAQVHARYREIFGEAPRTHGAAGWQMNDHAFVQLDQFGMAYASDGRSQLREDGRLADRCRPASPGGVRQAAVLRAAADHPAHAGRNPGPRDRRQDDRCRQCRRILAAADQATA
jgi:hypothetical protein